MANFGVYYVKILVKPWGLPASFALYPPKIRLLKIARHAKERIFRRILVKATTVVLAYYKGAFAKRRQKDAFCAGSDYIDLANGVSMKEIKMVRTFKFFDDGRRLLSFGF